MKYLIFIAALIFSACATPTPQQTPQTMQKINEEDLKLVLIKSQNIRFYDFGTLSVESSDENSLKIELKVFKLGKYLGSFVLKSNEVCYMDLQNRNDCASKWTANKSFFGKVSYDKLFEDILLKRDIFDGVGKRLEADNAVIQEFEFGGEKIYYERTNSRIYFKNFTNGVTVSIEDYKK